MRGNKMNYEAEINYHNLTRIETEPRYLGTFSGDDLTKLLTKVGVVCLAFDKKHGFKGYSLTVAIRELR